jgi:hypothetical protein
VVAACDPDIAPARVENAFPVCAVRHAVIDQQIGDDFAGIAGAVADVFPDRARPRAVTLNPSVEIAAIRADVAR